MNTDLPDHGIALPSLSDEAAVAILNFMEVTFQMFEARYARQIDRYYEGMSRDNIVQTMPSESADDDPPF